MEHRDLKTNTSARLFFVDKKERETEATRKENENENEKRKKER